MNGITRVSLHTGFLVFLLSSSSETSAGLRERFLVLDGSLGGSDRHSGGGGTPGSSGVDARVWPMLLSVGAAEREAVVRVVLLREDCSVNTVGSKAKVDFYATDFSMCSADAWAEDAIDALSSP